MNNANDEEIESYRDDLRHLSEELRNRIPAAKAVTDTARRLAERPGQRDGVRTAFGTRLSPLRAWSAAILIAPMLIASMIHAAPYGITTYMCELIIGLLLTFGLVVPLSWTRPLLFGGFAFFVLPTVMVPIVFEDRSVLPIAWIGAVVALLAPWRRGELTPAGWNLALHMWSVCAAIFSLMFAFTSDGDVSLAFPLMRLALVGTLGASIGAVARARWSSIASAINALVLVATASVSFTMRGDIVLPNLAFPFAIGMVATGVLSAAAAAVLGRRTAVSTLGTTKYLAH